MSNVKIVPFMMALVRTDAGLVSGSGSNPKRVRPAYGVVGISSVLDRGISSTTVGTVINEARNTESDSYIVDGLLLQV
jgi:hypothetical protein